MYLYVHFLFQSRWKYSINFGLNPHMCPIVFQHAEVMLYFGIVCLHNRISAERRVLIPTQLYPRVIVSVRISAFRDVTLPTRVSRHVWISDQ